MVATSEAPTKVEAMAVVEMAPEAPTSAWRRHWRRSVAVEGKVVPRVAVLQRLKLRAAAMLCDAGGDVSGGGGGAGGDGRHGAGGGARVGRWPRRWWTRGP